MKHPKRPISAIFTFILVYGTSSCTKKFLDDQNITGTLIREEYVTDLKTTGEYLNGVYATMSTSMFDAANTIYPDLIADNTKPIAGASGTTPMQFQYNWDQQPDNSQSTSFNVNNCNGLSYGCYQVIRGSNFVIQAADRYQQQDIARADDLKGQALAIRAYAHFTLLNVFAQPYGFTPDASHPGIVLIRTWNWTDNAGQRNTVAECYQSIIDDLTEAIAILTPTSNNLTFNQKSAKSLLARVYLYKNDFLNAKNLSVEVIHAVPLMTAGYPENLFKFEDTEAILQLPPAGFANQYLTNFASLYFKSFARFTATNDIADLLTEDPEDKRKAWISGDFDQWTITKFPEGVTPGLDFPEQSYLQPVIRSSEMYLTAAEAYHQLNNQDSAVYYLDAIRFRANPNTSATTATGNDLKVLIYKERRKELAFEGLRIFDLLRWKQSIIRKDALPGSPKELPYPSSHAIAPISLLDIDSYSISQNPEY
ncbi:RagB/SusD family nutrient uptake outer membrane protein [Chitinophaga sp. S165]|uniref:RagB/SusD family nutrient uptake outer membrane protein n=1 Tax=Chitinophaga sp. S165 TaxID=2135462 RepID=UPI000D71948A|nr:RagB/SusD family nutrient uptake outer membrane protein [Chitinophaga sp. S165]PWV51932.1 SusD-like starch-binding protein associating with outer membrane [Chitinophaga sp. S165]